MKKYVTKALSLLIMVSLIMMPLSVCAKSKGVTPITNKEIEKVIEDIIEWAKQGNDVVLSPLFLESAGETGGDWFPIGMGRYGYKGEPYNPYITKITQVVTERYKEEGKLHTVKATEWHRISLAILSMGGDPTNIGKDINGDPINLIADGSYNFVGKKEVDGQGINGAIWALICVDSMNYQVPSDARYQRDDLIALITKRQLTDGGFALTGNKADPDITGMALQALAPYYDNEKEYIAYNGEEKTIKEIVDESLQCLSELQSKEGDYYSWGTVNVESTVQVLTAVCSLGIDPYKDARFIKNGKTLIDGIMKYRCADGGFAHSFVNDLDNPSAQAGISNRMATEQTLYGLVSYYRLKNGLRRLYDFRPEVEVPKEGSTDLEDSTVNSDVSKEDNKTNNKDKNSGNNTDQKKETESDQIKTTTTSANSKTKKNSTTATTNSVNETTRKSDEDKPEKADKIETVSYEYEIPMSAFEDAKGKDTIIEGIHKNAKGEIEYTVFFHGEDIIEPKNFNVSLSKHSEYEQEILQLASEAVLIHINQEGILPGEALLELQTELEDGDYLVFTYDTQKKQANYYDKVEIKDGIAQFILQSNEEYFIAKGAIMTPLKRNESTENEESADNVKVEYVTDNVSVSIDRIEKALEKDTQSKYILAMAIFGGCVCISVCILIHARVVNKGKKEEQK